MMLGNWQAFYTWTVAAVLVATIALVGNAFWRRDRFLSPVVVAGLSIFFYLAAIPLEMLITGNRYLQVGTKTFVPQDIAADIVTLALVAYVAFSVGYGAACSQHPLYQPSLKEFDYSASTIAATTSSLFWATFLFAFYPSQVAAMGNYSNFYSERFASPIFSLGVTALTVSAAILAFSMIMGSRRRQRAGVMISILLIAWGIQSNSKVPILAAILALAPLYFMKAASARRPAMLRFIGVIVIAPIFVALATVAFSINRGGGGIAEANRVVKSGGVLTRVEPAGPMVSVVAELREQGSSTAGAPPWQSVIVAPVSWIPRELWPGRPDDPALAFAKRTMPNWVPGAGYGFSLLAEGYSNGGPLGVVVIFFLSGLLIAWIRNYVARLALRKSPLAGPAFGYFHVVILASTFTLCRAPLQGFTTAAVQGFAVVIMILGLTAITSSLRARNSAARPLVRSRERQA